MRGILRYAQDDMQRPGCHAAPVLVGHPEDTSLPHVDAANHDAGLTVGRAFLARGYASVGFIGVAGSPASVDRLAGLRLALAEVGLAIRPNHLAMVDRRLTGLRTARCARVVRPACAYQMRLPSSASTMSP